MRGFTGGQIFRRNHAKALSRGTFGTANVSVYDPAAAASRRALRISIAVEAVSGTAILAAVAWLGTLSPPISGG